jgi:hypothetical protein
MQPFFSIGHRHTEDAGGYLIARKEKKRKVIEAPASSGLLFYCNGITLFEGYLIAENKSDAAPFLKERGGKRGCPPKKGGML